METAEKQILEFFLPEGILEWFDVTGGSKTEEAITIRLEEKNIPPPLLPEDRGKKVTSKGLKKITVTDFPIRGRRVTLILRRRRWQIEGKKELLKRDIRICTNGTQLEKEFADFLKAGS